MVDSGEIGSGDYISQPPVLTVADQVMSVQEQRELADSVIAEYFKKSEAKTIFLNGFDEKLERRQELAELIESLESEKRQIEQELKLYMGEAEIAENERYRISWKPVSSQRIDEKSLKEERPEIYEKYRKVSRYRRLLVKAAEAVEKAA